MCRAFDFQLALVTLLSRLVLLTLLLSTLSGLVLPALLLVLIIWVWIAHRFFLRG
jgi:hypothetical protein